MHKPHVCLTKGSITHARDCFVDGGGTVSVDDGRGCGVSHIWSCLATVRSCFHLTQSVAVWISLRARWLCGGGIEGGTDQEGGGGWGGGGMFPERKRRNHV